MTLEETRVYQAVRKADRQKGLQEGLALVLTQSQPAVSGLTIEQIA